MRKEERFILRRMVFSIWETLRKIRSSSRSLSMPASSVEAEPWNGMAHTYVNLCMSFWYKGAVNFRW